MTEAHNVSAAAPTVTPNEWDTGSSVSLGGDLHVFADGTRASHNGFAPVRMAPNDYVHCELLRMKYHKIKLTAAKLALHDLKFGQLRKWDTQLFGPAPVKRGEYGIEADNDGALARMEAIVKYHATLHQNLTQRLQARGIDADRISVH